MDHLKQPKFKKGQIISADLTVENADSMRDFYKKVIGWVVEEISMSDTEGSYNDYAMKDAEGSWVGGICHHRGANKGIPPQWITYVNVDDIRESIRKCEELGGQIIRESKDSKGKYQYALIQDPTGAILGLTEI